MKTKEAIIPALVFILLLVSLLIPVKLWSNESKRNGPAYRLVTDTEISIPDSSKELYAMAMFNLSKPCQDNECRITVLKEVNRLYTDTSFIFKLKTCIGNSCNTSIPTQSDSSYRIFDSLRTDFKIKYRLE